MSERRACKAIGCCRMTIRYQSTRPDDRELRERMTVLARERRRFGYRRLHVLLRREGYVVIAEFERELIHERTGSGRVAAKQRGARFGRPPKLTSDQIALAQRLVAEGTSAREAAKMHGVHAATLYWALPE